MTTIKNTALFLGYTKKTPTQVLREFTVDLAAGLSSAIVKKRQQEYGRNALEIKELRWWHVLGRQFTSPFIYLLCGAAILAFILGERIDALLIFSFVLINVVLSFMQEYQSEKTLKLLKNYLVSHSIVLRDGRDVRVNKEDIVPGDVILLEPGDVIPADLRLVESEGLEIDESVLTGESQTVAKITDRLDEVQETYQATNVAFTGSTVSSGRGKGVVVAIGRDTVFGALSTLTLETVRESSFEKGMKKVSSMILKVIAITFVLLLLIKLFFPIEGSSFIEFVIFSIALAVSVIPEGLPLVITFTLSHGAKRLAANKVVVKRLSSIEDLGSIQVLCTDKTGTITENRMRVASIHANDSASTLLYARLASRLPNGQDQSGANTFDEALYSGMTKAEREIIGAYDRLREIPFDPARKRNAVLVEQDRQKEMIVRGAPEEVFKICIQSAAVQEAVRFVEAEGRKGHRTLAIAYKKVKTNPKDLVHEESRLHLLGCVSFYDPLKDSAIAAIQKARDLQVSVKILTGDSREVAGAIGVHVGLIQDQKEVMTGAEFVSLSEKEKALAVESCHIFARVSPEQKYEIIEILEKKYEVGFLGEGINDAPALKVANIGLAVHNASDVAREAADIILLNKSLSVIINGIEEGRRIFGNNVKYLKATLASNFGNFYAVVAASFLARFLPMLPVQILLLNLLSDFPMMAIAADTVDKNEIDHPRQYDIKDIALVSFILGFVSTVFDFMFFGLFYRFGPEVLRTNWFIASILTELLFLFSIRTQKPIFASSRPASIVIVLTVVAAIVTVTIPFTSFGKNIFHFVPPALEHLGWIAGLLVLYVICSEIVKLLYYKKLNHSVSTT